jgi:hypothetical protein
LEIKRYRTEEERERIISRIHKPNLKSGSIMSERMNRDVFYPLNLPEYDHLSEGFPGLRFISADEATHMLDEDHVVGIEHNGEAKAYPMFILDYYHQLNDEIGGEPIVYNT